MRNGTVSIRLLTHPAYGVSHWDFECGLWLTETSETLPAALKLFGRSVRRGVMASLVIVPDADVLNAVEFVDVARTAGIILNGTIIGIRWAPPMVEDEYGDPQPNVISREMRWIGGHARRAWKGDPIAIRALTPTHILGPNGPEELYIRTE
jgi:hypothetical protein